MNHSHSPTDISGRRVQAITTSMLSHACRPEELRLDTLPACTGALLQDFWVQLSVVKDDAVEGAVDAVIDVERHLERVVVNFHFLEAVVHVTADSFLRIFRWPRTERLNLGRVSELCIR